MKTILFLIRSGNDTAYLDFVDFILKDAAGLLLAEGPASLRVTLTAERPPFSIIPFRRTRTALFTAQYAEAPSLEKVRDIQGLAGIYEVERAVPIRNELKTEKGSKTPGQGLLTLFHQKPGLEHKTFIDRWYNGHTPLTFKIHPMCGYIRNAVIGYLLPESEQFDGIVEEHVTRRSDMLNPLKFFGGPLKALFNMIRVYIDIHRFIDCPRLETYFVDEYHLK